MSDIVFERVLLYILQWVTRFISYTNQVNSENEITDLAFKEEVLIRSPEVNMKLQPVSIA